MDGEDLGRAAGRARRRLRRRVHRALDESAFRAKSVRGATYHRSVRLLDDEVSFVARRFPRRAEVLDGPDFVLVHGIGVSSRSYGPTAAELARRGAVHLIDLPGYGASPRPGRDVPIAEHAAAVAAFIREAGLERPVVVGHSMGTQVVARLAVDAPEEVGRLVLIAPVIWPDARSFWRAARLLLADAVREPPAVSLLAINDYLFRAGIPYMIEQTPHLIGNRIEEALDRIAAPALVICGEADPIVPLDWGREIAEALPDGRFATVPGAHVAMFSDPVEVARLIADFAAEPRED